MSFLRVGEGGRNVDAGKVKRRPGQNTYERTKRGLTVADRDLNDNTLHDIREGLALAKGWLELVFRHWDEIEDPRRREMIAGALFGANRVDFVLDLIEGSDPEEIPSPQDRMAEEFSRIGEVSVPERFAPEAASEVASIGRDRPGTARFRP